MLNILQPWIQIRRFIRRTVFQFLSSAQFQDRNSCCVCHRWFGNVSSQIRSSDRVMPEAAFLTVHWAGSQRRIDSTLFLHYFDKILTKKKKRPWPRDPVVPACERSVDMGSGEKAINLVFPVERRRRSEPADVGRGGRFSHSWGAAGGTRHASTPPRRASSGAVNRVKVKAFSDRSRWPGDEEGKLSDCSVKQGNKTSRRDWTADSGVLTTGC